MQLCAYLSHRSIVLQVQYQTGRWKIPTQSNSDQTQTNSPKTAYSTTPSKVLSVLILLLSKATDPAYRRSTRRLEKLSPTEEVASVYCGSSILESPTKGVPGALPGSLASIIVGAS